MKYLLDTCVVSEFARTTPEARVVAWLGAAVETDLAISSLTIGELRFGVARLADGRRRRALGIWLSAFRARFEARVLDVDVAVSEQWAALRASAVKAGRTLPVVDGLLAATAKAHGLAVVTRNVADFRATGVAVVDPWAG